MTAPWSKSAVARCDDSYLVDSYRFAVQFDHVHDFDGVVCVVLSHEFDEAVALVVHRHPVLRHVHIDWRTETCSDS